MGLGGGEAEPAAALEKMWSLPYSPTLLPPGLLTPAPLCEVLQRDMHDKKGFNVMIGILGVWQYSIYKIYCVDFALFTVL